MYFHCIDGVGKEKRTKVGPWDFPVLILCTVLPRQKSDVIGTTLRTTGGPIPADSRQGTSSARDCVTSRLIRWRLTVQMKGVVESGKNSVSKHQVLQPECGGTAKPVSRDQILRREREQGNIHFFPCSANHEQDWQPYPVDPHSAMCEEHNVLHILITVLTDSGVQPYRATHR